VAHLEYRLTQTAAPTAEPVDLAAVKQHCRVTTTADDNYLTGLITTARRFVERHSARQLVTSTWALRMDSFPSRSRYQYRYYFAGDCHFDSPNWNWLRHSRDRSIEIPIAPLQSVGSIVYVDTNGDTQTLATDQYVVSTPTDQPGYITPAYNVCWPTTRCQPDAVVVTFNAGYGGAGASATVAAAAVPQTTKHLLYMLIAHWYENREAVGSVQSQLPLGFASLLESESWHGYP